jgi:hypothetical protein
MKGNKVIKPSKYFRITHDRDLYELHISEAFPEDEGMYKCVAENPSGKAASEAQLKVKGMRIICHCISKPLIEHNRSVLSTCI